jgi:uncharacterized protein DUF2334
MRYVILRDDDTNALTPVEHLERLYRPFLDRGLPVNLSVIPEVATDATMADGRPEGFLVCKNGHAERTLQIGFNKELVNYLLANPGYHVLQHGCHHNWLEFDCADAGEISRRLDHGTSRLTEAGFCRPQTFVAPYDKLSRASVREVAKRFRILSSGWYELGRLPLTWWPHYLFKKARQSPHWRIGRTLLLSHPGCLLSYQRTYSTMMGGILHYVNTQQVTVLVTHWWEYFREGKPDEPFIDFLHETAAYLANHPDLKVISFDELVAQRIPLN